MELLKLLGIVIVIAGFALKLDSILVILVAAVVTALVGGLGRSPCWKRWAAPLWQTAAWPSSSS